MILADESLDLVIIEAIQKKGIEVYSIFDLNRGISDEEVIQISRNPPRIILTEDKDFGE
jgi:predicted nuclease of predicted toxin-antitoxin system